MIFRQGDMEARPTFRESHTYIHPWFTTKGKLSVKVTGNEHCTLKSVRICLPEAIGEEFTAPVLQSDSRKCGKERA